MKRIIRIISFIFYLLLGVINIILGIYLINAFMNNEIFSITFSIVGTCLLIGGISCFYIAKSIGGRLSHDWFHNNMQWRSKSFLLYTKTQY